MLFRTREVPLKFISVEREASSPDPYSKLPSPFFRATANRPLTGTDRQRAYTATLTLERILQGTAISIDTAFKRPVESAHELWLLYTGFDEAHRPPSVDYLNELVAQGHTARYPDYAVIRASRPAGRPS